jgi:hypothetical protein
MVEANSPFKVIEIAYLLGISANHVDWVLTSIALMLRFIKIMTTINAVGLTDLNSSSLLSGK